MAVATETLDWMLDTDPALRWRVERDLAGAAPAIWQATRARVATEGMGGRLLALQDADGQWAGGSFFPGDFDFDGPEVGPGLGQPWTATTWTLNTLRDWGVDAAVLGDTAARLEANSRWDYDDLPYWNGEVDCCINSFTLMNGTWLGADVDHLTGWFLDHRLEDGGWNCEWETGSVRSSFHSTLNTLKGLLYWEIATGGSDAVRAARKSGEEYLLHRRLMFAAKTGELVGDWAGRFLYPSRWKYSALTALEYFRAASLHDGTAVDARLADAADLVAAARRPDGTWLQQERLPGRVWFDIDVPVGEPSPWVTFASARALAWWDASRPS